MRSRHSARSRPRAACRNPAAVALAISGLLSPTACSEDTSTDPGQEPARPTSFTLAASGPLFVGRYADPSVVAMPDGSFLMYLNRFYQPDDVGYFVLRSDDAIAWTEVTGILFRGIATGRALAVSGGVWFYFPRISEGAGSGQGLRRDIVSSLSPDGIGDWTEETILVRPRTGYSLSGPTVFVLPDGSYRMFFDEIDLDTMGPNQVLEAEIHGATSPDNVHWTRDPTPTIVYEREIEGAGRGEGAPPQVLHPFVVGWPGGGWLMLYNAHNRFFAAHSSDGRAWVKLGAVGFDGADIDAILLADRTYRVHFGDPDTIGQVDTGILTVR